MGGPVFQHYKNERVVLNQLGVISVTALTSIVSLLTNFVYGVRREHAAFSFEYSLGCCRANPWHRIP